MLRRLSGQPDEPCKPVRASSPNRATSPPRAVTASAVGRPRAVAGRPGAVASPLGRTRATLQEMPAAPRSSPIAPRARAAVAAENSLQSRSPSPAAQRGAHSTAGAVSRIRPGGSSAAPPGTNPRLSPPPRVATAANTSGAATGLARRENVGPSEAPRGIPSRSPSPGASRASPPPSQPRQVRTLGEKTVVALAPERRSSPTPASQVQRMVSAPTRPGPLTQTRVALAGASRPGTSAAVAARSQRHSAAVVPGQTRSMGGPAERPAPPMSPDKGAGVARDGDASTITPRSTLSFRHGGLSSDRAHAKDVASATGTLSSCRTNNDSSSDDEDDDLEEEVNGVRRRRLSKKKYDALVRSAQHVVSVSTGGSAPPPPMAVVATAAAPARTTAGLAPARPVERLRLGHHAPSGIAALQR